MALLDIIIETLKINCSVVQCTGYPSEIEALFFLVFFPSVFIILFIWVVTGVIMDKTGGKEGGLRILISIALYAFIVFQGYYNFFVSLSKLWWILLATLVGLWIFIRVMIHGKEGSGATYTGGFRSGRLSFVERGRQVLSGKLKKKKTAIIQQMKEIQGLVSVIEKQSKNPEGAEMSGLFREYNARKQTILALIDEIDEFGKFDAAGVDWSIVKLGEKYENELKEFDKRIANIREKVDEKIEKAEEKLKKAA